MKQKRTGALRSLLDLFFVMPALFGFVNNVVSLAGSEIKNASQSMTKIVVLSIIFLCLLLTFWCSCLALFFIYLTSIPLSPAFSLVIILLINLILMIIIGLIIMNAKKNLFFPGTARLFRHLRAKYDE